MHAHQSKISNYIQSIGRLSVTDKLTNNYFITVCQCTYKMLIAIHKRETAMSNQQKFVFKDTAQHCWSTIPVLIPVLILVVTVSLRITNLVDGHLQNQQALLQFNTSIYLQTQSNTEYRWLLFNWPISAPVRSKVPKALPIKKPSQIIKVKLLQDLHLFLAPINKQLPVLSIDGSVIHSKQINK